MADPLIVAKSEPFFFPGGPTGCILLHGFTSMPEEMRPAGEFLRDQGFTVLGLRLAGHGTHPDDLARTCWRDWMVTVEEGLAYLRGICSRIFLIGQSMGGMLALLAAARYAVSGVVTLSTPYDLDDDWRARIVRLWSFFIPVIHKGRTPILNPKVARREHDYPAYPFFPSRSLGEVEDLKRAMRKELPRIEVPVLIVQSRKDASVPPENAEHLYAALRTPVRELCLLDECGHSIALDPNREIAFRKITDFIQKVNT
jgi:carboxylesterase